MTVVPRFDVRQLVQDIEREVKETLGMSRAEAQLHAQAIYLRARLAAMETALRQLLEQHGDDLAGRLDDAVVESLAAEVKRLRAL